MGFDCLIFSLTPAYTFSQNRGTAHMHVGCISRRDCRISAGTRLIASFAPSAKHRYDQALSNTCVNGRKLRITSLSERGSTASFALMAS